jgi:hypothetical protein
MARQTKLQALGRRMLRPYRIPESCPYLSDEQRELSLLTLPERIESASEWLVMARTMEKYRMPFLKRSHPA